MLKQYNIRLDTTVVKKVDKLKGCRSEHIRNALTTYIQPDPQNVYNVDICDILKDQIQDLKHDKDRLQDQVSELVKANTIATLPFLERIKLLVSNKQQK